MKYINHDDDYHKIVIIPRTEEYIDSFELYHELNDKTYQIDNFDFALINGYLEITFSHTAKQGNIFVYKAKAKDKLVSTGKIETLW